MKKAVCLKSWCVIVSTFAWCACDRPAATSTGTPASAPAPREVKAIRAATGAVTRAISLPAQIKPLREATLYAKVTGYLKTLAVDKGDEVSEGMLLAEIEVPELAADAAKYKAEVELANLEYQRVGDARKKAPDLVVPLSVDTARSRAEVARANLERAETLLAFTKISAPFAGIVTRRYVDPGAFVPAATSGSPQNAALITLVDFKTVRVQVAVPESEAALVQKGQGVKVTVEGLRGKVFPGQITRYAYALDPQTRTMLAEVELANPALELRPGMYATARIGIETKPGVLLAPAEAIVSEKASSFVYTLADQTKARKTPVKVGFADGERTEIVSGLAASQAVLVPLKGPLADGQPVKVLEAQ